MCPHCGSQAPIIHRGLAAYCTSCGRPRQPLSSKSVSLSGKPSQIGGLVAGVLGWVALIGGLALALLLALLAAALFPGSIAPWVIGLPIGLLALGVGLPLLLGGRRLHQTGAAAERSTRVEALFSLAANRGGALTARDVGIALDMPEDQADALLTTLAKERSDDVTVEIGERGEIFYAFPGVTGRPRVRFPPPPARIDADAGAARGVTARAEAEAEAEEAGEVGAAARRERAR